MPSIPRLPAEWEKQDGTLITWPHKYSDWVDSLDDIDQTFCLLAKTICQFQKLVIVCFDQSHQKYISQLLTSQLIPLNNITFLCIPTNDTWMRDYGPIFLSGENKTINEFVFNGWGNKYSSDLDNAVSQHLYKNKLFPDADLHNHDFVLEGGSIDCDGRNTLLTTSACLLTKTRNPLFKKENINHFIEKTLGIKKILWLDYGYLSGDDTDSHIDMLARFVNASTIVYIKCTDKEDEHYNDNLKMEHQLRELKMDNGDPYNLVPLPFTDPIYSQEDGRRLPASYANFLIINHAVLVPTYNDIHDKEALDILATCFPDRKIIGIPFLSAIEQNGSLHCLTMQIPEGYL